MAKYTLTINTGPNEELGLTHITALHNAAQHAATPKQFDSNGVELPSTYVDLTNKEYLQLIINSAVTDYKRQYKQHLKQQAADAVILE